MVGIKDEQVIGANLAVTGYAEIPLLKLRVLLEDGHAWSEQITVVEKYPD